MQMKYCATKGCPTTWMPESINYCPECGVELTPEIQCQCGKNSYNPKLPRKFCSHCGVEWTPAYLGTCMKAQLGELVQQVAQELNGQRHAAS